METFILKNLSIYLYTHGSIYLYTLTIYLSIFILTYISISLYMYIKYRHASGAHPEILKKEEGGDGWRSMSATMVDRKKNFRFHMV